MTRFARTALVLFPLALYVVACGPSQPAQIPEGSSDTTVTPPATADAPPPPPVSTSDATPPPADDGVLTVERLVAGVPAGAHVLEAFVVEVKPCPECPPTISCRPCLGDFIVVHDAASPPADAAKPMLKVKPDQIKSFQAGKRYRRRKFPFVW